MSADPRHGHLDPDVQGIHIPFQFTFEDQASRTGAPASRLTGGASKLALQLSDFSLWQLSSVSPTPVWIQIGAGSTGGAAASGDSLGTGFAIFKETVASTLQFKSLIQGDGVNLSSGMSTITITASAGGDGGGSQKHANFTVSASTGDWDSASIPVWQGPLNTSGTLSQIQVDVMGSASGTSGPAISFNLTKRDWGNLNTTSGEVDILTEPQTVASGGSVFTSFNDSSIDPQSHVLFTTSVGAESGIVNYLTMTIYYTQ